MRVNLDNPEIWRRKLDYAADQNLAGVYVWRLDFDDFAGSCGMFGTAPEKFPFTSLMRQYFPPPVAVCDAKKDGGRECGAKIV